MGKQWLGLIMAMGIVGSQFGVAVAEDRKTLEELLFDKGVITKDEAASVQGRKLTSWVDKITFSGDFRLRDETFYVKNGTGGVPLDGVSSTGTATPFTPLGRVPNDRHRDRFRLRLAADLKVQDFTVGIRLASNSGEQFSTNQSFDNLATPKPISIDRAYLRWQNPDFRWVALTGGRMQNPFFTVYSSDVMWDDDINPEGFAENFNFKPWGNIGVFFNLAQIVLDEDSGGPLNTDQWLWGNQVGLTVDATSTTKVTLAGAYYKASNPKLNDFGQVAQGTNSRVGNNTTSQSIVLVNDYDIYDLTAHVGFKVLDLPVAVMGDMVRNMNATTNLVTGPTENRGFQAGTIVGKASDPQTWEFAYFYKALGADATLADLADSDFGAGGTGRLGNIMWVAYNPSKPLQLKAKYFITKWEDQNLTANDVKRLQLDLSVKF